MTNEEQTPKTVGGLTQKFNEVWKNLRTTDINIMNSRLKECIANNGPYTKC